MHHSSMGEFELITHLTARLRRRSDVPLGVGDDCAILDLSEKPERSIQSTRCRPINNNSHHETGATESLLLATCDSQVEGVHFTLKTSSPEQIGRKALAVNVSDIAAMGGEPRYALISLILPKRFSLEVLEGIYRGLDEEAHIHQIAVVGGNTAGSAEGERLIIDITLLGIVERGHAILRSGARPGDIVCVTGHPGDSAAGLATLLSPQEADPPLPTAHLRTIHQVPTPRVAEGRLLSSLGPSIITAMLDVSDGVSGDLSHICERSQVGAVIEVDQLPLSPEIRLLAAARQQDPVQWALHGGEDYELLFTVAPEQFAHVQSYIMQETGTPVTAIGVITPQNMGQRLRYADGREETLVPASWDHLRE